MYPQCLAASKTDLCENWSIPIIFPAIFSAPIPIRIEVVVPAVEIKDLSTPQNSAKSFSSFWITDVGQFKLSLNPSSVTSYFADA